MKHQLAIFGKSSILALLIAVLLLAGSSLTAHAQTAAPAGLPSTLTICAGSSVPNGYIVYNDTWIPTECGDPTFITDNVQYVEPYYNVALDGSLTVCSGTPLPSGWIQTSTTWTSTACGQPAFITNNVKTIERTSIGTPSINPGGVINGAQNPPGGIYSIHAGTTLSIYGFNFNAPDLVIVNQGSNQWVIANGSFAWFDGNPLWAQINATLPTTLTPGFATVFVQNAEGLLSSGQTITIS